MSNKPEDETLRLARNVRRLRMMQGKGQEDLARLSGVSPKTIYRLESGVPTSRRSLLKVCAALEVSLAMLHETPAPPVAGDGDYDVHRGSAAVWYAMGPDRRTQIPRDDFERIQDPEERRRQGWLGIMSNFASTLGFVMPEGPGRVMIELYARWEGTINDTVYRECLLVVERGTVRVGVLDDVVELSDGDVLGYRSKDLRWLEPTLPVGSVELPAILTWTGAVRLGSVVQEKAKRRRAERRADETSSEE